MREIGSYEAKTHLPAILRAVEKGATIAITRNGARVARIVPEALVETDTRKNEINAAIKRIISARGKLKKIKSSELISARDVGRS